MHPMWTCNDDDNYDSSLIAFQQFVKDDPLCETQLCVATSSQIFSEFIDFAKLIIIDQFEEDDWFIPWATGGRKVSDLRNIPLAMVEEKFGEQNFRVRSEMRGKFLSYNPQKLKSFNKMISKYRHRFCQNLKFRFFQFNLDSRNIRNRPMKT